MGKHNIHDKHPLQYIRRRAGLTQQEFADRLGIPRSTLAKREAFTKGYAIMPDELHRQLRRQFGAFVIADFDKPPGPDYYLTPTGLGGVPYTAKYAEEHMRERIAFVKHSPTDVIEALKVVGKLCALPAFQRQTQFAESLAFGIKALCASPRLRIAISQEIKKMIRDEKAGPADWLCGVIEDDELRRRIPSLPSQEDHQLKVVKKLQQVAKRRGLPHAKFYANGHEIDASTRIKKSDIWPPKK